MNVCFTVDSLNAGGAERVVSTLANEMSQDGCSVSIIIVSANSKESFYHLKSNINVVALSEGLNKRVRFFKRIKLLKRAIKSINPDVVISFSSHICIYTWLALRKASVPFICSERNDPHKYPVIYRILNRMAFRAANGCVFQTKDALRYYFKKDKNNAIIIRNPVFLTTSANLVSSRKKTIVAVGRLVKQKNYCLLFDAFEIFYKSHSDFSVNIYGKGPLEDDLKKYISNKEFKNNVHFLGTSSSWHEQEKDASMFLLTSNFEGMPNCLAEAIALGIPSIATDCPIGGPKDLIDTFGGGFLVPMNDKYELANKMADILNNLNIPRQNDILMSLSPKNISKQWIEFVKVILKDIEK